MGVGGDLRTPVLEGQGLPPPTGRPENSVSSWPRSPVRSPGWAQLCCVTWGKCLPRLGPVLRVSEATRRRRGRHTQCRGPGKRCRRQEATLTELPVQLSSVPLSTSLSRVLCDFSLHLPRGSVSCLCLSCLLVRLSPLPLPPPSLLSIPSPPLLPLPSPPLLPSHCQVCLSRNHFSCRETWKAGKLGLQTSVTLISPADC